MKNLQSTSKQMRRVVLGHSIESVPCRNPTDSTLRDEDGQIISSHCTLDSGFEYSYTKLSKNGVLAVMDERQSISMPVGVICNYTAPSEQAIKETVDRMIHLYKNHQTISIACSIEEFNETFKKIA